MSAKEQAAPSLGALHSLLASAQGIVEEMVDDPILERVKRALLSLPEADRRAILKVIERDATWVQIVKQTTATTGIAVRPNPHASLYVHVLDEPGPSQRDVDVIGHGIERFVQLLPLFFQEGVHEQWTNSARALIRASDPRLRGLVVKLAREVVALVDEAGAQPVTDPEK